MCGGFRGPRRNPQFSQEAFFRAPEGVGIRGVWREALGNVRLVGNTEVSRRNYWHGPPPKPLEGVEVSTGGVPWRFTPSVSI
jgi:hypothetical protein